MARSLPTAVLLAATLLAAAPRLVVEFTPPPMLPVVEIPTLSPWGWLGLAALLAAAGVRRLRRGIAASS